MTYTVDGKRVELDKEMAVTDMFPVIQNGTIFCVVSIKSISKTHQKSLLVILKIIKKEKGPPEIKQIFDKLLVNEEQEWNYILDRQLAAPNGDNIYFSYIKNQKQNEKCRIEVWKFNFTDEEEKLVYWRDDDLNYP